MTTTDSKPDDIAATFADALDRLHQAILDVFESSADDDQRPDGRAATLAALFGAEVDRLKGLLTRLEGFDGGDGPLRDLRQMLAEMGWTPK